MYMHLGRVPVVHVHLGVAHRHCDGRGQEFEPSHRHRADRRSVHAGIRNADNRAAALHAERTADHARTRHVQNPGFQRHSHRNERDAVEGSFQPESRLLLQGSHCEAHLQTCCVKCEHLQAIGEPPLCLAATVFYAIKHAIRAAREEVGLSGYFPLHSPATCERIRMACQDQFTSLVSSLFMFFSAIDFILSSIFQFPEPKEGTFTPWFVEF